MQTSRQQSTPFSLPQQRILTALAEMGEASNVQLCRRWYRPTTIANVWRNIAALEREKLIGHRPRILRQSADGPAQRLYYLTAPGARAAGTDLLRVSRSGGYIGQEHRYLVNDLWCALHEWERESDGRMQILDALHDSVLKRNPLTFPVDGKEAKVVPDSWYHLKVDGGERRFWVEADRGTEDEEPVFRRKIRRIVVASRGAAQAQWGGSGFRVLFLIHPLDSRKMEKRTAQVLAWTEKELTAMHMERFGALFLVAACDPGSVSGASIFTAPWFRSPFDHTKRAVIPTN